MSSIPFTLLKPWSAVTSGICNYKLVAATRASGNLIFCCCRRWMAMVLTSELRSISTQSSRSCLRRLFSNSLILGQPNNSFSEITDTAATWSKKGFVIDLPSYKAMRKFVSTTKSIPFIANLLLIAETINVPLQFTEMLTKRFFFLAQSSNGKCLLYFFFCDWPMKFDNHTLTFTVNVVQDLQHSNSIL